MTGDRSEVYLIQPYVIVCDDCGQIRSVHNTTICDKVCDDWGRSKVYSIQPYVIDFVMTGDRSEVYSIDDTFNLM